MRNIRFKSLCLATIFLLVSFVGVTWGAEKVITVPMWWAPHEIAGAQKALDELFTPESGIKVILEFVGAGYHEKMWTRIAAHDPYDLITMNCDTLREYAEKGALMPLNDFIERDNFDLEDFFPVALKEWMVGDTIYGLTNDLAVPHVYYAKDLFEEAGLPLPRDEWTWDEFLEAAKKLTKDIDGDGKIDQWGWSTDISWFHDVWPGFNGAFTFNKEVTKCLYDDPKVIEAFQFQQDLVYKYKVAPTPEILGVALGAYNFFLDKKMAMIGSGTWTTGFLRAEKPEFEWDVVMWPRGSNATEIHVPSFTAGWVIPKEAEDPEASWEVLKFYASKYWADEVVFKVLSSFPTRRSTWAGAGFYQWPENPPEGLTPEFCGKMILAAESVRSWTYNLGSKIRAVMSKMDLVLNGQEPAEPICKEIAEKVNELLKTKPWYKE